MLRFCLRRSFRPHPCAPAGYFPHKERRRAFPRRLFPAARACLHTRPRPRQGRFQRKFNVSRVLPCFTLAVRSFILNINNTLFRRYLNGASVKFHQNPGCGGADVYGTCFFPPAAVYPRSKAAGLYRLPRRRHPRGRVRAAASLPSWFPKRRARRNLRRKTP